MTVDALPGRFAGHRLTLDVGRTLAFGAIAAISLQPVLGPLSAAFFLLTGALLMASNPVLTITALARWWPLLILPAYCVASTLWSQFPSETLRYGLQLAFTLLTAIVIAARVPAAAMLRGLFAIFGFIVLLSLVIGRNYGDYAWHGIFESKNAFAAHIAFFAVVSTALMFDREAPRWLRILSLIALLASFPLLLRAQSAGAVAVIGPTVLTVMATVCLRRLTGLQKAFALLTIVLALAVLVLLIAFYGDDILAFLLDSSGKDSTLTGRTDLWQIGLSLIGERPFFGVGYHAFWVKGYGPAEQLWSMFHEVSGAGFNFHDTYISNAVDLGLVGLAIQLFVIFGAAAAAFTLALVRPNHVTAFLVGLQLLLILRSPIEVDVFIEFGVRSVLAYLTFVYAFSELRSWRNERAAGDRRRPLAGARA